MTLHLNAAFLEELGQRILTARNLRGLSRKALAEASGISQAQIARLERGGSNISIARLHRISSAMDIRTIDLIPLNNSRY
jgi:XRE family aerobic/anaerobic benzoate catabolism transcriptional regulator